MTLEEIETIMIDNLKTDKVHFGRTKLFGFENASKLILASHLRSQISLLKEMIARMGDKDDIYQLRSKLLRLDAELTKLNQ